MAIVLKRFRDKEDNAKQYEEGDSYTGKRAEELAGLGFVQIEPSQSYEDMKVSELKELLKEKGIEFDSSDKKADLIEKLK